MKHTFMLCALLISLQPIKADLAPICLGTNQFSPSLLDKLHQFAQVAYSTLPTLYNSFEIAALCIQNTIEGDFVECGVASGAQVAAMAYANQTLQGNRKMLLFDSFEGIPLAGPNDDQQPGIGAISHNTAVDDLNQLLITSGVSACSLETVVRNMSSWGIDQSNFVYHKGWFQHVLPVVANSIEKIAVLRLDGDLYESTKVCLEYLYSKVVKGGFVIIDDYGSLTGCRRAVHEYLEHHDLHPQIIPIEGGQGPVYWQVD